MKIIKVAYIRTQFWFGLRSGGSVGHTLGIISGFKDNGADIKILANEAFYGIEIFDHEILEPLKKRPQWFGELLYNLTASGWFRKKIGKYGPDLIYHRYSGYTFFVSKLARALGIPAILEFNSFDSWKLLYWEKSNNPLKRFFQRTLLYPVVKKIELYNLDKAALIVTVSETLRKDLTAAGIDDKKIMVNPNGYDSERFTIKAANDDKSRQIRAKIGKDKVIIGFCGTFGAWHGIFQLTEAIKRILEGRLLDDAHFLIIGDGRQLKKHMVEILSKYSEVTFTGTVPYSEIHYYLAACDILLSPHNPPADSRDFFGSPTKMFEYMGMGKGIIASDLGQIGEVLEDMDTAVLVPPGDVDKLIESILLLAKDKELRKKLGEKAGRTARKKYSWNKNVERLLAKIKEAGIIDLG